MIDYGAKIQFSIITLSLRCHSVLEKWNRRFDTILILAERSLHVTVERDTVIFAAQAIMTSVHSRGA